ncbi:MAG: diguanylate cyclase, partial [Beijerinckiaceae bacterium]|nr:diguanylate cyclase [Beijerinckiaceae bacterium]
MANSIKPKRNGTREPDRLSLLKSYNVIEAEPAGVFDDAVTLAARICCAPVATLAFFESRRQWFKACVGVDMPGGPLDGSLNAFALQKNENILIVEDIAADGRFPRDPVAQAFPGAGFYAGALLTSRDGAALGVLSVYGDAPRPGGLDGEQINALLAIAGGVMRELEGRKAQPRAPEANARAAAGAQAPAMSGEMSNDQLHKALLLSRTVAWEFSLPANRLVLGDNARDLLGLGSALNMTRFQEHIHPDDLPLFDGAIREAMTGSPGEVELRFRRTRGRQAWLRVRAQMLSHFSVAGTFVDITADRQRDRSVDETGARDQLTGLTSRAALQEELIREMKLARLYRTKLAVLFVDVDDLEEANGAFGHPAGDAVLREAGRRLSALVGDQGRVGR